jgi:Fe-S-cluster containining protein
VASRVRPLLIRPGARFVCHGDGLCCTDVHLLGPLSRDEGEAITRIERGAIVRLVGLRLLDQSSGSCVFLEERGACRIYDHDGGRTKPRTCDRYPFLLVATPDGGRVGTDHRCPCRTLGERPPLTPEAAEGPLKTRSGRLMVDRRMGPTVAIEGRRRVGWRRYRALEAELFAAIERDLDAALGAPFPALEDMSWPQVAGDLALDMPATKWGWACRTFAVFVGELSGGPPGEARARPWKAVFNRAEARSAPQDPEAMLRDFVLDAIWSLEWAWRGPLSVARAELATRVHVIRAMARHFTAHGSRPDRAMAEALSVAEIAGVSDTWSTVVQRMRP